MLTTLCLFGTRQQEQEILCSYIHMFNIMGVEVPSATPDLLISTFIQVLRHEDLFKSLLKKPPTNFEGLLSKGREVNQYKRVSDN